MGAAARLAHGALSPVQTLDQALSDAEEDAGDGLASCSYLNACTAGLLPGLFKITDLLSRVQTSVQRQGPSHTGSPQLIVSPRQP